jgi:hypothetical protein
MTHTAHPFFLQTLCQRAWRPGVAAALCGLLTLGSSAAGGTPAAAVPVAAAAASGAGSESIERKDSRMWMTVGERRFAITLADTDAARAFAARLPLVLDMTDLNSNEKKFDLPYALPANASRPGTIRHGDLMLYGANTVVLFYLTFDSPYAYTRLGRVDDPAGLAKTLGQGSVRVAFSRR